MFHYKQSEAMIILQYNVPVQAIRKDDHIMIEYCSTAILSRNNNIATGYPSINYKQEMGMTILR